MALIDVFSFENKNLDALLLSRGADKLSTEMEGETVILDLTSGAYSGLDEVGTTIWNLLEQPKSFADICQRIMAEYAVEEDVCRTDLLAFLKDLADNGLITLQDGPTV